MRTALRHVSPYSGSWYPGDAAELRGLLDRLFAESARRTGPYLPARAAGFVVPHAALIYSGTVAASVYRHIGALAPARIILIGFSHHGMRRGVWIPDVDAIETPLGEVEVDRDFAAALAFETGVEQALCDHSVEIQLPLLQAAAPATRIVPVYVSPLDPEARRAAAGRLASLLGPDTILVASSDFTHYGRGFSYQPFPVDELTPMRLRELDESVIEAAGTLAADEFMRALESSGATVCGRAPIALLLETLGRGGEIYQERLDYQTSGEITGGFHQSVSYAALGYFPASAFEIGPEEGRSLVESARRTLARYLETGERNSIPARGPDPALDRRAGVFVTLHSQGRLRGCIGRMAPGEPLRQTVPSLALSAALDDTRFPALTAGEPPLDVEISVLSPMKRIASLEQFRVNEHGALLEAGHARALLLPQVALERGWSAAQFFEALAHKAGVRTDAYANASTKVFVFRAQVIR
ncbi:MAG: AmmeMemoRadiSam system protein B [Acidobacteriota bacterium]